MFVNYFHEAARRTPVNLLVARVVVGLYAIWKLAGYDFVDLLEWPQFMFATGVPGTLPWAEYAKLLIPVELVVAYVALVCFTIGYRTGLSAFVSALAMAHLVGLHYGISNSGATAVPAIYFLVIFAIFRHEDKLSIDHLRRDAGADLSRRASELHPHSTLKYVLLTLAICYFFTGYSKVSKVGWDWANADNLNLLFQRESFNNIGSLPAPAVWMMEHRPVRAVSNQLTLILELGFLVAVLTRIVPITPFVLGLMGLHMAIFLTMRIWFFDMYLFLALFLPWDRIYGWFTARERAVVYCQSPTPKLAWWLWICRYLDVHGALQFRSLAELPAASGHEAIVLETSAGRFAGAAAVERLLAGMRLRFLSPWVLRGAL